MPLRKQKGSEVHFWRDFRGASLALAAVIEAVMLEKTLDNSLYAVARSLSVFHLGRLPGCHSRSPKSQLRGAPIKHTDLTLGSFSHLQRKTCTTSSPKGSRPLPTPGTLIARPVRAVQVQGLNWVRDLCAYGHAGSSHESFTACSSWPEWGMVPGQTCRLTGRGRCLCIMIPGFDGSVHDAQRSHPRCFTTARLLEHLLCKDQPATPGGAAVLTRR